MQLQAFTTGGEYPDKPYELMSLGAWQSILTSAHVLVHEYPGKAPALAPKVNKTSASLSNEVNYRTGGNAKLGVLDAVELMLHTENFDLLMDINMACGFSAFKLGDFSGICDAELLNFYGQWHGEIGDVAREVSKALEDNVITQDEFLRIRREGIEQIHAFLGFLARLEGLVEVSSDE